MDINNELIEKLDGMAGIDVEQAKQVLEENSGNIEMAINFLQEQGIIEKDGLAGTAMGLVKGFLGK